MEPTADNKLCTREKTELYYQILSGGARLKLLESVMDFNLPELIGTEGSMTLEEIIDALQLSRTRAQKWLYLLGTEGFLIERKLTASNTYTYSLGPILKALYDNGNEWQSYKELIDSLREICFEDITDMLQGGNVSYDYSMTPKTLSQASYLEDWMSNSAAPVIKLLNQHMPLEKSKKILDVGGGDGTIVCALAKTHPNLQCSVFNIPEGAQLAKNKIEKLKLTDRITVIEGDFIKEESFPKGYDIILFSRVLCDWPEEVCRKLIKMAFEALNDGGYIVICEEFKDLNQNLVLIWEFRYMYWDSYEPALFKPSKLYENILKETGFSNFELSEVDSDQLYRVIKAKKYGTLAI